MKKMQINKKGFTLVELLVSVGLFTVVAFFSLGALLSIYDGHKKTQSSKTVVDNLNLSIEDMTRTIRFGRNYHCTDIGTLSDPRNCNNEPDNDTFLAVTFNGNLIAYRLNGTAIQRSNNPSGGESTYFNITAPEVKVEYLRFYVGGAESATEQPYAIAVIKGYVGSKPTTRTTFSIETLMSQRALDI